MISLPAAPDHISTQQAVLNYLVNIPVGKLSLKIKRVLNRIFEKIKGHIQTTWI